MTKWQEARGRRQEEGEGDAERCMGLTGTATEGR